MAQQRNPIQIRDPKGETRRVLSRIAKRHKTNLSAAVIYAANFCDSAERQERPPLDYAACDLSTLQTLIVYGFDHFTRAAALTELDRRYRMNCKHDATVIERIRETEAQA